MSAVWNAAEMLGIVPTPPNATLTRLLAKWWERPRTFACAHARTSAWVVVAPDPAIVCTIHAPERLEAETRCAYCKEDVDPFLDSMLVYEMRGVTMLGRAHVYCELMAGRA